MGEREARARSFGAVADAYERARPGYPAEAVRWLVGDEPLVVADLGAGTGKLTRELVALGHDVVAVEPSREMLVRLAEAVRGARALAGSAEAIPLADGSADAVVAGQAFHWFDHPVALREIARVLRPGGRLGLVWNIRDDAVPWVARLSALIGAERLEGQYAPGRLVGASARFGPVEEARFRHEQRLDRDGLLELVSTRSYVATRPRRSRARILDRVGRLYDEVAGAGSGSGGLVLPYVTHAYRARRRDA